MHCRVSIDLLNPETGVKEQPTHVANGEITNIYKYLSTSGYPEVCKMPGENTSYTGVDSARIIKNLLNPEVCAGGLICSPDATTDENFFYPNRGLTAYGTKYDADYSAYSSKYGVKDRSATIIRNGYCSQTWEFGPNQGNGEIKSVCLTHQASAHAFDDEDFTANAAVAKGSDFSFNGPMGLLDGASSSTDWLQPARTNGFWYGGTSFIYSNSVRNQPYYVSENYFVFFRIISMNVSTADGYVTTLAYKRVRRSLLREYQEMTAGYNQRNALVNAAWSYSDAPYEYEGTIELNTGNMQVTYVWYSDNSFTAGGGNIQDRFCAAFVSLSSNYSTAMAPISDGVEPDFGTDLYGPARIQGLWCIEGDDLTITNYGASAYRSHAFSTRNRAYRNGFVTILKNHTLLYSYTYQNVTHLINRQINGTLISDTVLSDAFAPYTPFLGKNIIGLYKTFTSVDNFSGAKFQFYDFENYQIGASPSNYGVFIVPVLEGDMTNSINMFFLKSLFFYEHGNPVFISYGNSLSTQRCYLEGLMTNYLFTKVNFRAPVVKTSEYKMRITVELFMED